MGISALAVLLLPSAAAATGGQPGPTGGQPAPDSPPKGDGRSEGESQAPQLAPAPQLRTRASGFVGAPMTIRGTARGASGRTVAVEGRSRARRWVEIATARVAHDGSFATTWTPGLAGRITLRAVLRTPRKGSRGRISRASPTRTLTVYEFALASWYGPGLYGNRLACGGRLSPATVGVAHRTLRCGTKVALRLGDRSLVVSVIDRGPYVGARKWDLTAETARRIGLAGVRRIGAAPLRRIGVAPLRSR